MVAEFSERDSFVDVIGVTRLHSTLDAVSAQHCVYSKMLAHVSQETDCAHPVIEVNVVDEFELTRLGLVTIVFLVRSSHRVSQMGELALKASDIVVYCGLIKQVALRIPA